jgi:hypothetical protein
VVPQVLDATPELSRLKAVAAIVSEPLKKEFGGSGQQFTLFAPTNAAIECVLLSPCRRHVSPLRPTSEE